MYKVATLMTSAALITGLFYSKGMAEAIVFNVDYSTGQYAVDEKNSLSNTFNLLTKLSKTDEISSATLSYKLFDDDNMWDPEWAIDPDQKEDANYWQLYAFEYGNVYVEGSLIGSTPEIDTKGGAGTLFTSTVTTQVQNVVKNDGVFDALMSSKLTSTIAYNGGPTERYKGDFLVKSVTLTINYSPAPVPPVTPPVPPVSVPEPSSLSLLMLGSISLMCFALNRRKQR